jgi:hypothetical protein
LVFNIDSELFMVCAVWGSRSMVAVVSELSKYFFDDDEPASFQVKKFTFSDGLQVREARSCSRQCPVEILILTILRVPTAFYIPRWFCKKSFSSGGKMVRKSSS